MYQTSIYKKYFYLFYQEGQDHFNGNEKSIEDQKQMKTSHNHLKDEDHGKINQGIYDCSFYFSGAE